MAREPWVSPMLAEVPDLGDVRPPLAGHRRADVCIVGGGYLGLWTALGLVEASPGLSVTVVEADMCGGGASGRNSGMALAWWPKIEALVEACGETEALRLASASAAAIGEIEEFCRRHAIDAEFARTGWLWGATCRRQEGRWRPIVERLARLGAEPFRLLDRAAVRDLVEADGYRSGAFDATAATLHPAKLARGLRRVALANGVAIHEKSPMVRLERGSPPVVETAAGRITAGRVILAINAWSLAVPELRSGIFVITSDDAVTGPAPEFLDRHRWRSGPLITDAATFVSGYRPTRDGRIVAGVTGGVIGFGRLAAQRFDGPSPREADIAAALKTAFPAACELSLTASWRGPIDRTRTGLPRFGRLPGAPDILFGYGFSGNGIVGCRMGARILVSLALERRDEWSETGLVGPPERWMPPEPFRYIGAHLVRWAVRQKDRRDREDRDQGAIAAGLAALAPGGIVTTRRGNKERPA